MNQGLPEKVVVSSRPAVRSGDFACVKRNGCRPRRFSSRGWLLLSPIVICSSKTHMSCWLGLLPQLDVVGRAEQAALRPVSIPRDICAGTPSCGSVPAQRPGRRLGQGDLNPPTRDFEMMRPISTAFLLLTLAPGCTGFIGDDGTGPG